MATVSFVPELGSLVGGVFDFIHETSTKNPHMSMNDLTLMVQGKYQYMSDLDAAAFIHSYRQTGVYRGQIRPQATA